MLILRYWRQGGQPARFSTTLDSIEIKNAPPADLVLRDGVPVNARLVRTGGTWFLHTDAGSINGLAAKGPVPLGPGDRFGLGYRVFEIESDPTTDEELALLARLETGDEASRAVYADWLEEHGHAARAEFLRAQLAVARVTPTTTGFEAATERVRTIARALPIEWRMRVARPAVEDCKLAQEFTCGVDWAELVPTADPKVRSCTKCREPVHYCTTEDEAIELARAGRCLVVDFAQWRTPMSVEALVRRGRQLPAPPGTYMPRMHQRPAPVPAMVACSKCGRSQPRTSACADCGTKLG